MKITRNAKKIRIQAQESGYISKSTVWIFLDPQAKDLDVDNTTTRVYFDINIAPRGWGIPEPEISLSKIEPIEITIKKYENDETETEKTIIVNIEATEIKKQHIKGNGLITIDDINLYLNADLSINYDKSFVEILMF